MSLMKILYRCLHLTLIHSDYNFNQRMHHKTTYFNIKNINIIKYAYSQNSAVLYRFKMHIFIWRK